MTVNRTYCETDR